MWHPQKTKNPAGWGGVRRAGPTLRELGARPGEVVVLVPVPGLPQKRIGNLLAAERGLGPQDEAVRMSFAHLPPFPAIFFEGVVFAPVQTPVPDFQKGVSDLDERLETVLHNGLQSFEFAFLYG